MELQAPETAHQCVSAIHSGTGSGGSGSQALNSPGMAG